ncbi:MAG: glycoside hydrolase family 92 protein [Bacillota bacterium]|nr:glycoside hydrolase family 92 protein [Bacillota bacterium]
MQDIKQLLDEGFSSESDGFPGDEDNGSMAAWYVLSSIGVYQFAPGIAKYLITFCQFDEVIVKTDDGKEFKMNIQNEKGSTNLEKVILNGDELDEYRIKYSQIISGGELKLIYK